MVYDALPLPSLPVVTCTSCILFPFASTILKLKVFTSAGVTVLSILTVRLIFFSVPCAPTGLPLPLNSFTAKLPSKCIDCWKQFATTINWLASFKAAFIFS